MADPANVFEGTTPGNVSADLMTELVGEGKKYKTVEDLARSRLEADIHIKRVETENAEMREKLAKAASVEDILAAVKAQGAVSANETPDPEDRTTASPGLTTEQVAKIVAEQVSGIRTKEVRDTNRSKANAEMIRLFGDKAQEVFLKEATTPELQATYKELAELNPDKFVAIFKKPETNTQNVDTGGKNIQALNLNQDLGGLQPGTQAFYSALRKKEPKTYFAAATQLQMHKDAMSNPDKYFGRA